MKSWKLWVAVLAFGAALAAGCGGDDDDDTAKNDDKGKAGTKADEPSPVAEVPDGGVACGNKICEKQEGSTATLCCADAFAAKCGMMQGGQGCVPLIPTDPRCPSIMAGGAFMLASCCTDDNQCGIDTSMFNGNKCTDLATAAMQSMSMMGGGFITFPPPKPCE